MLRRVLRRTKTRTSHIAGVTVACKRGVDEGFGRGKGRAFEWSSPLSLKASLIGLQWSAPWGTVPAEPAKMGLPVAKVKWQQRRKNMEEVYVACDAKKHVDSFYMHYAALINEYHGKFEIGIARAWCPSSRIECCRMI